MGRVGKVARGRGRVGEGSESVVWVCKSARVQLEHAPDDSVETRKGRQTRPPAGARQPKPTPRSLSAPNSAKSRTSLSSLSSIDPAACKGKTLHTSSKLLRPLRIETVSRLETLGCRAHRHTVMASARPLTNNLLQSPKGRPESLKDEAGTRRRGTTLGPQDSVAVSMAPCCPRCC